MRVRTAVPTSRNVPQNLARIMEPVMSEATWNYMRMWPLFLRLFEDFSVWVFNTRMPLGTFATVCLVLQVGFVIVILSYTLIAYIR